MSAAVIEAADTLARKRVAVLDSEMSYVDEGEGDPIVFLHGNPTSSYLWRNVIPHLRAHGRCLAPDLIGMGFSGRSPRGAYTFVEHARYLDAWFETLALTRNVTLVVHDWGSALGFHRARRHPGHFKGIAYMEAIVLCRRWSDFGEVADLFRALRSPAGEAMVLDGNAFVETVLPRGVLRSLSDAEMAAYRAPFPDRESRRPTLVWPRQIPIEGQPADVAAIVGAYAAWASRSAIPKLLVLGDPGAIVTGRTLDSCRDWPHQTVVTVRGRHFLQEDSPHEIGGALRTFVKSLER